MLGRLHLPRGRQPAARELPLGRIARVAADSRRVNDGSVDWTRLSCVGGPPNSIAPLAGSPLALSTRSDHHQSVLHPCSGSAIHAITGPEGDESHGWQSRNTDEEKTRSPTHLDPARCWRAVLDARRTSNRLLIVGRLLDSFHHRTCAVCVAPTGRKATRSRSVKMRASVEFRGTDVATEMCLVVGGSWQR